MLLISVIILREGRFGNAQVGVKYSLQTRYALYLFINNLIGYGHDEGNGMYSIVEKSISDWAKVIHDWVRLSLILKLAILRITA